MKLTCMLLFRMHSRLSLFQCSAVVHGLDWIEGALPCSIFEERINRSAITLDARISSFI